MKEWVVRVESDVFGICDRLKSIDDGYFVVYDRHRSRFEVHNSRQRGSTFALAVPYASLDARVVELVRKTRVENAERLLSEMERENARREKERVEGVMKSLC